MTAGHQGLSLIACCRHDDTIEEIALDDITNDVTNNDVSNNDVSMTDGIGDDTKSSFPLLSAVSTWNVYAYFLLRTNPDEKILYTFFIYFIYCFGLYKPTHCPTN